MLSPSLRYRAPLAWVALPFMGGLILARFGVSVPLVVGLALSGVFLLCSALLLRDERWLWGLCLSLAMLFAGSASFHLHRPGLGDWEWLPPREARLVLRCERLFASSDPSKISGLATVLEVERPLEELKGRTLYFRLPSNKKITLLRSSVFRAVGVAEALPFSPPDQGFERYLVDSGVSFRLSRGTIREELQAPSGYFRGCDWVLARMRRILGEGIAHKRPELTGVFRAMLLGQQREMSEAQTVLYRNTGAMHLFSISGMHITVIAAALHGLFSLLRLPRLALFVLSLVSVWLYVDVTGRAPSAVRAFVMVALVETAFLLRKPVNPLSTLVLSTLVVLFWDPLQIFGASFQMSYGIVAALLLLGTPLGEAVLAAKSPFADLPPVTWSRIQKIVAQAWRWTVLAVCAGLAASTVGTLTGVYFFELLTPGALLVNLALIPLSGYVLLSGLLSLFCGLLCFDFGASVFNHSGALVLQAMEFLARKAEPLPGMSYPGHFEIDWVGGLALLLLLGLCFVGYSLRWKPKAVGLWLPFAYVFAVVAFAVKLGTP